MKLLLDLNVLLDMVQRREPFYFTSAAVVSKVVEGEHVGYLPGHAVTTLHYVIGRYANKRQADEFVDWLLAHFEIISQDKAQFLRARALSMSDFEDAALAAAAEAVRCDFIVTRNLNDFEKSPVEALSPEELLG